MITSKSNEQVKYIANLKNKKFRDMYSKFVIEGIKLIDEISSGGNPPELIAYCDEILKNANGGSELLKRIIKSNINIIEVSEQVFNYMTDTTTPQGILAVINIPNISKNMIEEEINKGESFIILDKIQDPGNIGTIIRSCVAFNVKNIICTKGTVDVYSPKIVRSTMGAINKVNLIYLEDQEFIDAINKLKDKNYEIVGTSLQANKTLKQYKPTAKTVYVMGNEANGVSSKLQEMVDVNIKIEIENTQESLNVSIATGILLYNMYQKGSTT